MDRFFAKSVSEAFREYYNTGNTARLNRRLNIGRVNAIRKRKMGFFQQR